MSDPFATPAPTGGGTGEPAPLGLRVVEVAGELTGFVGWLLRGLGCSVTHVGQCQAGRGRARGAGRDTRAVHEHAGKERRELGGDDGADRAVLDGLLAGADVLVESLDAARRGRLGLDPAQLTRRHPKLVIVSLSPLGSHGPRRDWQADDLVVAALSGLMAQIGHPIGAPLAPPCEQTRHLAGVNAAIGALLGVWARRVIGRGQQVEVSALQAAAASLETGALSYIHLGRVPPRPGNAHPFVAHKLFRTATGWMAGGLGGNPRMWSDLLAWVGETRPDLAEALSVAGPPTDPERRAPVFEVLDRFVADRSSDELFAEARARRLPWAPVRSPAEVAHCPQLAHRGALVTLADGDRQLVDVAPAVRFGPPGVPPSLPANPPPNVEPCTDVRGREREGDRAPALAGVRVLDLTWVLAGPYATRLLADHGAQVIKVESTARPDPTRFSRQLRLDPLDRDDPDTSGYFNNVNRNKHSVTLNLRTEEGRSLLVELAKTCDIVIDNYSAGALERLGLGFDRLAAAKPDLVSISMSGLGSDGPLRDVVGYADGVSALSGFTSLARDHSGEPVGVTFGLADVVAGLHAALAAVAALEHRARTGRGCRIDLSQLEAMATQLGDAVLRAANPAFGPSEPDDPAPVRGVFPCLGHDRWCVVSASDDQGFARLAGVVPGLAGTPRWATASGRRADRTKLDDLVSGWTRTLPAAVVAEQLQAAGVPAGVVQTGADLVEHDEQLRHLGFYQLLAHPVAGSFLHEGLTIALSATPGRLRSPAPRLGEHTAEVLGEIGVDTPRLAELQAQGVVT